MYAMAKQEIGLRDEERMELACAILWRDITSWKQLEDAQVIRMLDAMEGFEKIVWLLANRSGAEEGQDRLPTEVGGEQVVDGEVGFDGPGVT